MKKTILTWGIIWGLGMSLVLGQNEGLPEQVEPAPAVSTTADEAPAPGADEDLLQLIQAAGQGDAAAQNKLGWCYYNGTGVDKNLSMSVAWYRKAAEQGYAPAQSNLAICYDTGEGVVMDKAVAAEWYRKAAEQGLALAQHNLGTCYDKGEGVAVDKTQAVAWYRKAAEQGFAGAQHNLGVLYDKGEGVVMDKAVAVEWWRKAAEQGLAEAQCCLAICYDKGEGVAVDKTQAAEWWRKAAEQGLPDAQYKLAFCYYKGEGVVMDKAQAVEWWRKSAEQGFAGAQFNLALRYYEGEGVAQDKTKALAWCKKAAEQGLVDAQYMLGSCYLDGVGVAEDKVLAVHWLRKAAEQGHAKAQYKLGECYALGRGVDENAQEARYWLGLAAFLGVDTPPYLSGYVSMCNLLLDYHGVAMAVSTYVSIVLLAFLVCSFVRSCWKHRLQAGQGEGGTPASAGTRRRSRILYYTVCTAAFLSCLIGGLVWGRDVFAHFYLAPELAAILLLVWLVYFGCRKVVNIWRSTPTPNASSVGNRMKREDWEKKFCYAIEKGKEKEVLSWLEKGVDVNKVDLLGEYPLDIAMGCGRWKIASILRAHGAVSSSWSRRVKLMLKHDGCIAFIGWIVCALCVVMTSFIQSVPALPRLLIEWSIFLFCIFKIAGFDIGRGVGYSVGSYVGAIVGVVLALAFFPLDMLMDEIWLSLIALLIFSRGICGSLGWGIHWLAGRFENL